MIYTKPMHDSDRKLLESLHAQAPYALPIPVELIYHQPCVVRVRTHLIQDLSNSIPLIVECVTIVLLLNYIANVIFTVRLTIFFLAMALGVFWVSVEANFGSNFTLLDFLLRFR